MRDFLFYIVTSFTSARQRDLDDGRRRVHDESRYRIDKSDYEGFVTRRMGWESVIAKFNEVTAAFTSERARSRIVDAVQNLEEIRVRDFTAILADLTQ